MHTARVPFRHVYPGDIEHIVAKKNGREYHFKWENLTIACSTCNTNKGTKENLVDPYIDEPEKAFHHAGPMILADPSDDKAGVTEIALSLNRKALVERRAERLKGLHLMLKVALAQTDAENRQIYLNELVSKETRDEAEYAAMVRCYVADLQTRGII